MPMPPYIFSLSLLLILLVKPPILVMGASTSETLISRGSSIDTSSIQSFWSSPSGRFAFGFYPEGSPGKAISDASTQADYAAMSDTGNFVLYDTNRKVIWSTFSTPTDTLLPTQEMHPGYQLLSSVSQTNHARGKYRLANQRDGNLVMYPAGTMDSEGAYWSTGTYNMGLLLTVSLDPNGTLWMFDGNASYTKILFQTNQSSGVETYYRLTFDADGMLRLYSHAFRPGRDPTTKVEWLAPGSDRCMVNGVCGPNSFCHLTITGETSCSCLPGFDFLSINQTTLGCWRTLSTGGCVKNSSNDEREAMITMAEVKNVTWLESSYALLPASTSIEDCKNLCFSDCACEIAMFKESYCSKQTLPMRYGKMPGINTTLFVKVYPAISVHHKSRIAGKGAVLISVASLAFFSLVVLVASVLLICNHRQSFRYMDVLKQEDSRIDGDSVGLQSFSFQDLVVATNGFTEELGRGAYGTVFKGVLANTSKNIAVKRLEKMAEDGEREFHREVRAIARTYHQNLLRLLGFCNEGTHHLLVYEYMPNGSLANLLFNSDVPPSWSKRIAIALGVARGLQYLHEEIECPIIHCDIKPENILIDSSGKAKIADFGLAKLLTGNQANTFTGIRGTRGYLAPEWSKNTAITVKADVYSYGIMLLEIISCKNSVELKQAGNEYNISEWAYECVMFGEAKEVADDICIEEAEVVQMVKVGIWCTQNEPAMRPSMKNVTLMIEGSKEVRQPPPPASFSQSLITGTRRGKANDDIQRHT